LAIAALEMAVYKQGMKTVVVWMMEHNCKLVLVVDALHSSLAHDYHFAGDFAKLAVASSSSRWPFAAAVAVVRGLAGCLIDHLKIRSCSQALETVVNYTRWVEVVGSHY
jgi:hypothetical protein